MNGNSIFTLPRHLARPTAKIFSPENCIYFCLVTVTVLSGSMYRTRRLSCDGRMTVWWHTSTVICQSVPPAVLYIVHNRWHQMGFTRHRLYLHNCGANTLLSILFFHFSWLTCQCECSCWPMDIVEQYHTFTVEYSTFFTRDKKKYSPVKRVIFVLSYQNSYIFDIWTVSFLHFHSNV